MYRRETVFKITVVDRYMVYIFSVVILFSLIFIPRISVAKPTFHITWLTSCQAGLPRQAATRRNFLNPPLPGTHWVPCNFLNLGGISSAQGLKSASRAVAQKWNSLLGKPVHSPLLSWRNGSYTETWAGRWSAKHLQQFLGCLIVPPSPAWRKPAPLALCRRARRKEDSGRHPLLSAEGWQLTAARLSAPSHCLPGQVGSWVGINWGAPVVAYVFGRVPSPCSEPGQTHGAGATDTRHSLSPLFNSRYSTLLTLVFRCLPYPCCFIFQLVLRRI